MTVDLLKLFVAFGNVIGSIYYFIFDWTNDFHWPIEQINAFILRSSLYWRLKWYTCVTNVKLEHLMILSLERIMNVTILTWQSIF